MVERSEGQECERGGGRNSREIEPSIKIMVGCREEVQQEATTSLAVAVAVPGCAHPAPGEPHLPQGWSWKLSQHSASGDVGLTLTFPQAKSFFLSVGFSLRMLMSLLTNGEKK